MRDKIIKLIVDYPRHYSKMIRGDTAMRQWIIDNSLIGIDDFAAAVYSAVNQQSNICKNGNKKKFKNFTVGFVGCGPAAKCQCTKESIAENVKIAKSEYTDEKRADIASKRESTTLERFGVINIMKLDNHEKTEYSGNIIRDKNDIVQLLHNGHTVVHILSAIRESNKELYSTVNTAESLYLYINDLQSPPTCINGHPLRFITFKNGYANNCKSNCNATQAQALKENWSRRTEEEKSALFDKMQQTNIERYGVNNVMKSEVVKDKLKNSNIDKYGVEFPLMLPEIQQKCQDTMEERYGEKCVGNIPEFQEKRKETCLEKYGSEHTMDIARSAYKEQTGFDHYFCDPENQAKNKDIWMERYGVDHPLKSKAIKDKVIGTMMERYGCHTVSRMHWTPEIHSMMDDPDTFKDILLTHGFYGSAEYIGVCEASISRAIKKYGFDDLIVRKTRSQLESDFEQFLTNNGLVRDVDFKHGDRTTLGNGKELDFYFPNHKLAIELNGVYFHSELSFGKNKHYHIEKTDICDSKGIQLLTFWDDEWRNNQSVVESKVLSILGRGKSTIGARKCSVGRVHAPDDIEFLNKHHIQGGFPNRTASYGLYYDGKLVALISVKISGNLMEIIRFSGNGTTIMGGFSKLLKYALSQHPSVTIVETWADRRVSVGKLYINTGFSEVRRIKPDYMYTNYRERYRKENFRKQKLQERYDMPEDMMNHTEWELCQSIGLDRVWDCGKILYRYIVK